MSQNLNNMTDVEMEKENQIAIDDGKYWKKLGEPMGWELLGFSYRGTASYTTPVKGSPKKEHIQLTGNQMEQIAEAIQSSKENVTL